MSFTMGMLMRIEGQSDYILLSAGYYLQKVEQACIGRILFKKYDKNSFVDDFIHNREIARMSSVQVHGISSPNEGVLVIRVHSFDAICYGG